MLYELNRSNTRCPKSVREQIRKSQNDRLDLLFTMALIARHGNAVRPNKNDKTWKNRKHAKTACAHLLVTLRILRTNFPSQTTNTESSVNTHCVPFIFTFKSTSGRTFEKSSAMTPQIMNKRVLVINQIDAVSELLFEITLKGNALWVKSIQHTISRISPWTNPQKQKWPPRPALHHGANRASRERRETEKNDKTQKTENTQKLRVHICSSA